MSDTTGPRIAPGRLRALGPINWVLWRALSLSAGTPDAHLFSTLGQTKGLFRGWLHYSGKLMPGGKLTRYESELVILRVAHLRECRYEWDHHRRLGQRAGVTDPIVTRVQSGPTAEGWSDRDRALLTAVDELVTTKNLETPTWTALTAHYPPRKLIELTLLITQYDGLATLIATLGIERDEFRRPSLP